MPIPTMEQRKAARLAAQPDTEDTRHTYSWSKYGIEVRDKKGEWAGFYRVRYHRGGDTPGTRLVLIGYRFGECPPELLVGFLTLLDIERTILVDELGNPRFVMPQEETA